MAMAGTNDNTSRIARSAALTLVISVAVLYLGDRFGMLMDLYDRPFLDCYMEVMAALPAYVAASPLSFSFEAVPLLYGCGLFLAVWLVWLRFSVFIGNYRAGEEAGSARWGTRKEGEAFRNADEPDSNILLTEHYAIATRRKDFDLEHDRNLNVMVIGGSGSGKTRYYVKPNLMQMKGDSVVVFETLYRDGKEITAHADIDDEGQTVEFTEPSLGTTAEDGIDGDQSLVADGKAVIVDNVSYKGLVPGKEYKVVGTLMLKDTGEPLLDANGKSVTAETTFTPDHDHGTVDVTFTFDASLLAGQQVVVFETLYRLDKEITVHADIEDENQTIEVIQPGVDTVAVDGFDGDKDVVADPEAEITDTLSYKNVIPGSTYEVHGILMDAETGLPLLSGEGADKVGEDELTDFWHELCDLTGITSAKPLDEDFDLFAAIGGLFGQTDEDGDGDEVWFPQVEPDWEGIAALLEDNPEIAEHLSTATETFEADKDHGEIEMDFGLDASDLAGKKAVVFELLVKDGIAVGAHSDLADEDQTVTIVPSTIGTEATDKTDGDHEVMVSKEVTIVDAVHYENLLPGKEYTVKGVLMDKSTGKPLMVGDKKVEASASFTPNKPNGTVELEFTFDATGLEDKEVVAFETLYKDGIEVATHADIDDAAQTVKFVKPPKGGVYDKTGNMLSGYGWVAALLVVAAVAGAGYAGKQYLDARKEKDGDADGGES